MERAMMDGGPVYYAEAVYAQSNRTDQDVHEPR